MAQIKAFAALRPAKDVAQQIAALPYDVYTTDEAIAASQGNPYSFLHIDKAEIDLEAGVSLYDARVYQKAAENLAKMVENGWLVGDGREMLYIYRLEMDGRRQTGLVALASVDEYINGTIKRHELTREDKERDRIEHIKSCNAQTGPIFLAYDGKAGISAILSEWTDKTPPAYDFVSSDNVRHTVWTIDDAETCAALICEFKGVKSLYIADGHHRNAAAAAVCLERRARNPNFTGGEPFNHYLSVLFPADELNIMAYNRVLEDLNGFTSEGLLSAISENFSISPSDKPVEPQKRHEFGMYVGGKWFTLTVKPENINGGDAVSRLDVSLLHRLIIEPLFGVTDVRNDKRIDFIGGIRGVNEISRAVDGGMKAGFSLFPTSMGDLIAVSDTGGVMPPKSTWFEPKLRSGLFIHNI